MHALNELQTQSLHTAAAEPEAPVLENPLSADTPRLSGIHEKTKKIVEKAMTRDAKKFDEAARAQASGQ